MQDPLVGNSCMQDGSKISRRYSMGNTMGSSIICLNNCITERTRGCFFCSLCESQMNQAQGIWFNTKLLKPNECGHRIEFKHYPLDLDFLPVSVVDMA